MKQTSCMFLWIFLQNYYPSRHHRGTQKYNISHWNFFSIRNCHISITFTYYIAKQHLQHYMDSKSLANGNFIHLMKGDGLLQWKIIIIFLDIVMQMCGFVVITCKCNSFTNYNIDQYPYLLKFVDEEVTSDVRLKF